MMHSFRFEPNSWTHTWSGILAWRGKNWIFLNYFLSLIISVRLNERKQKNSVENKKMAYVVDLKTVSIGKYGFMSKKKRFSVKGDFSSKSIW